MWGKSENLQTTRTLVFGTEVFKNPSGDAVPEIIYGLKYNLIKRYLYTLPLIQIQMEITIARPILVIF